MEAGVEPVLVERDVVPAGSTALSAGLIPAAGTRFQRAKGIFDSAHLFFADIQRKAKGQNDASVVRAVTENASCVIEWLADRHGFPFDVIDNFSYPGHSAKRMHSLPTRTGLELINRLRSSVEASDITILTGRVADRLCVDANNRLCGIELARSDRRRELVGSKAVLLACNGFGGNPDMVRDLIPEMADALYFGHPGNRGNAITWGRALGAELAHLSAYQGHGSVATPHNILITWAVIVEGGIQVNTEGRRFCDESQGYSEHAAEILRQPGGIAWTVFDERTASIARQFEDFLTAERAGAILTADTIEDLAALMRVPISVFVGEWTNVESLKAKGRRDLYGRTFSPAQACGRPLHAVKVTGALFHTQGGLAVDAVGRVRRENGTVFSNLFAAGGAACGVSGTNAAGYLSGNGLLTATVLGRLAGVAAAALISGTSAR
jgi:fumarate reductase flavoprotein subunit